jgi:hypothetical protein
MGKLGIAPYIVSTVFLILKSVLFLPLPRDVWRDKFLRYIIVFAVFTWYISIFAPFLWEGSDVHLYFNSNATMDGMNKSGRKNMSFGFGQIFQICYVTLLTLSIICIYKNRSDIPNHFTKNIFFISIIFVVLIGIWEFTAKTTEWIYFPYDFFYNNTWYAQLYMQGAGRMMRLNSTFLEPSFCGAFLSASFWSIMTFDKVKYKCLCIPIGITLIFNLSGTGWVSFVFGFFIYVFFLRNITRSIISLLLVGFLLVWVISEMHYFENIVSMLMNKKDSISGIERGAAAYLTWELFLQTWGIGIGLGSVFGSSFLLTMLASIGVLGVYLLGRIYVYLFRNMEKRNRWLIVFTTVVLIGQCLSIPALSYPIMWMYLFMGAALLPQKTSSYERSRSGSRDDVLKSSA